MINPALSARLRDVGLLILRVGLGIAFLVHGWPKITGGPKFWTGLGSVFPIPPAASSALATSESTNGTQDGVIDRPS